jgi:hypothetical protein
MKFRTRGRFNVRRWSRVLADRVRGDAFERALRAARAEGRREFVFAWNRGLGDIALGLCPLFARIRAGVADSAITVFTRAELGDAFRLTDADRIEVIPDLARGMPVDLAAAAAALGVPIAPTATTFADPDPTRWLDGRREEFPPVLQWNPAFDAKADALLPPRDDVLTIGAHVDSETARYYGYVKDWPAVSWRELIARFPASRNVRWVLFGNGAQESFAGSNVSDLRGRTDFLELLAVIRARCRVLVAPDSGVLTMAYYLAGRAPLDVVSLWSDPRQGVLKQRCPSPNPLLRHVPLVGRDEDVRNIAVDDVAAILDECLAGAANRPRETSLAH